MVLRLLKPWTNSGTHHMKGAVLSVEKEDDAQWLIDRGIAEKVENPEQYVKPGEPNEPIELPAIEKIIDERIEEMVVTLDRTMQRCIKQVGNPKSVLIDTTGARDMNKLHDGGFQSFSHFVYDVTAASMKGQPSETLTRWDRHCGETKAVGQGLNVIEGSSGGYLIPEAFLTLLLERRDKLMEAVVRPRATVLPPLVGTDSVSLPDFDDTSHATNLHGGVQAYWLGEGATITKSQPKLTSVTLHTNQLMMLTYLTGKLAAMLQQTGGDAFLMDRFASAINWFEDQAYIKGTGAGQPTGLLNSAGIKTIAKETGQAGATIVLENVLKMWQGLWGKRNAVFIINPACWQQLMSLSLSVGTGGIPVKLFDITNLPTPTMLGRPVLESEHCAALGTVGDIILADLGEYLIADQGEMRLDVSTSVRFTTDEIGIRLIRATDGQLTWRSVLTLADGSTTMSPVVVLATRA